MRFSENMYEIDINGCWVWTGATCNKYGAMNHTYAHRVSYEIHKGVIPEGFDIDHLCRNKLCVNPSHLEAVTRKENLRRGLAVVLSTHALYCVRGHLLAGDNVRRYLNPDGSSKKRTCRVCKHILEGAKGIGKGANNRDKTHCADGHPLSGDNIYTYTDKKGQTSRSCIVCKKIKREIRARKVEE